MNDTERSMVADANAAATATTFASTQEVAMISSDEIGAMHVEFNQTLSRREGVRCANNRAHERSRGSTVVNGNFISVVALDPTPSLSEAEAARTNARRGWQSEVVIAGEFGRWRNGAGDFRTGRFDRVGETANGRERLPGGAG